MRLEETLVYSKVSVLYGEESKIYRDHNITPGPQGPIWAGILIGDKYCSFFFFNPAHPQAHIHSTVKPQPVITNSPITMKISSHHLSK